jgi:hypothetical protein
VAERGSCSPSLPFRHLLPGHVLRSTHARHQLTAGGGRHTLDRGDDRLGQIYDLLHHVAAHRPDVMEIRSAAIRIAAAAGKFLEVMSGAERRSIGSKHNRSNSVVSVER